MEGARLEGQRIVLGVSGSIAAVQAPALAARLRALGAEVQPVATPAALRIVGPEALRDACGSEPVAALTGEGEHVRELQPGGADLLLLAPCTAHLLAEVAHGLAGSAPSTYACTLLGRVPVLLAPAMHDSMWDNPAVRANLATARGLGCSVVEPEREEGAAKMASPEAVEAWVLRLLGPRSLAGRKVLVVTGPTAEPLGEGLALTNRGSGATGIALAQEAFRLGAEVEVWLGAAALEAPPGCAARRFATVQDLVGLAPRARGFDAVLVPAAVGDYAPAGAGGKGRVALRPTPKFLDALRQHFDGPLVAFKAESGLDDKELLARTRELQERVGAVLVVGNDLARQGSAGREVLLVEPGGAEPFRGSRRQLAEEILKRLAARLAKGGGAATQAHTNL